MTALAQVAAENTQAPPPANKPDTQAPPPAVKPDGVSAAKLPEFLYVMDTTAVPGRGTRTHEMKVDGLVKPFTFEPGTPLKLPFAIAIKFLRIDAFKRTDEHGDLLPYHRQPKQPHELAAGERFQIEDHQTVAEYNELSNMSLLQRVLELPGGELVDKNSRQALIDFIIKTTIVRRKANEAKDNQARAAAEPVELTDTEPFDEE